MQPGRFPGCENIVPMKKPRINDDLRHLSGVIFLFSALCTDKEQREGSRSGMCPDHGTDIGDQIHFLSVFLFQDFLKQFRILNAVPSRAVALLTRPPRFR